MEGSYEALSIFVQKWKINHPNYVSPYGSNATATATTSNRLRMLASNVS